MNKKTTRSFDEATVLKAYAIVRKNIWLPTGEKHVREISVGEKKIKVLFNY